MYALADTLDPDAYEALASGDVRRDGPGRIHGGRRIPLSAPRTGRRSIRRPQRDVAPPDVGCRTGGNQDDDARHLLPPRRRSARRSTMCRPGSPMARSISGSTASAPSTADRLVASVPESTRCAPWTRTRCGPSRRGRRVTTPRCTPTSRSSRDENTECLGTYGVTPSRDARLGRRARVSGSQPCMPPTSTQPTSRRWRSRRSRLLHLPDDGTRAGRRYRADRCARGRRGRPLRRLRRSRRDRPVRGGQGDRTRRAPGVAAPRHPPTG